MILLGDEMSGLGVALLPVAAALLFEELTFGGLVRLLIAPWPGARKNGAARECGSRVRGRIEHKNNYSANQKVVCGAPEGDKILGECGGGK